VTVIGIAAEGIGGSHQAVVIGRRETPHREGLGLPYLALNALELDE